MQVSKISLWICALTLCGSMTLHAEDTPAQAAARAALMKALGGNPPAVAQPPVVQAPQAVAPAPVAAPAPAMETPTAPANNSTTDTPAQAAARAALMKEMGVTASTATQTPAAQTPATTPISTPAYTMSNNTQTGDNEAQVRARVALMKEMGEMGAPATGTTAAGSATNVAPVPIIAPALPISMSKEQKLNWLTQLYKSDQVSPQQYYKERAAILAAP